MPDTVMGPTLQLAIDARGARTGAQQFDDAADRIAAGGRRIDASLRGIDGRFELSQQIALPAIRAPASAAAGHVERPL